MKGEVVGSDPVMANRYPRQRAGNLFVDLRREPGLTILFTSHDLSVIRKTSRVVVMYAGRVAESALEMGSEGVSCMLEKRPGALRGPGNGDSAALHNPGYDSNDSAALPGPRYWLEPVRQRLPG